MAFLKGPTNFVNDMIFSNCQRPFYIYVLTFIPCFIEAVIMLRVFDFDDLVRARGAYLAKRGGRSPRGFGHGRFLNGRELPKEKPHRGYRQGLKHLLALTQPLEHIGFALLMFGVVDKFYSNWMLYLDDADACITPDFYGPLIRQVTDGVAHPNAGGNTVQLPDEVSNPAHWPSSSLGANLPIGRYRAILGVTIKGPSGGANYQIELRATGVLGSGSFLSEEQFCAPGTNTDFVVACELFMPFVTGGQIQWLIRGPGVPIGLEIPKADVYVQRQQTAFDSPE